MRIIALALTLGICGLTTAAHAYEPPLPRWTRVTMRTAPEQVVNYATMTQVEAEELRSRARAALLYDRGRSFDDIGERGIGLRATSGAWIGFGPRGDAYQIRAADGGYGAFAIAARKRDEDVRLDSADTPLRLVLGIPARNARQREKGLPSYDPLVAVFDESLFLAQYVTVRVSDPLDPTRSTTQAQVATAAVVPMATFLTEPVERFQILVTLSRRRNQEPRVVFLPIDGDGALEPERDGFVLRLSADTNDIAMGGPNERATVIPRVVRLHFGDRESLRRQLASMAPPPRERFADPGGPTDPLMLGPRSPRDPLGAGVSIRSGVHGELDLLSGRRTSGSVQPAYSGVSIDGWVGRVGAGIEARQDWVVVRGGGRTGSMRDTNYTFIGAEIGGLLGGGFSTSRLGRLAVGGVVQSRRLSQRSILGLPFEMGNSFRAGTPGVEYELSAGLRAGVGRGWVVSPAASGGFRYRLNQQRGFIVVGVGVEVRRNANVFRTPTTPGSSTSPPPRSAAELDRGLDPLDE